MPVAVFNADTRTLVQVLEDNSSLGDLVTPMFHAGPVQNAMDRGEAELADVLRLAATDKAMAADAALVALRDLDGVEGHQARELRERLSRAYHALKRGQAPDGGAGQLGPHERYCVSCEQRLPMRNAEHPDLCGDCYRAQAWSVRREERIMPEAEPAPLEAPITKPCKACGAPKPLDEFPLVQQNRDGRDGTCKACREDRRKEQHAGRAAQRAEGEAEGEMVPEEALVCARCGDAKAPGEMHTSPRGKVGDTCRKCVAQVRTETMRRKREEREAAANVLPEAPPSLPHEDTCNVGTPAPAVVDTCREPGPDEQTAAQRAECGVFGTHEQAADFLRSRALGAEWPEPRRAGLQEMLERIRAHKAARRSGDVLGQVPALRVPGWWLPVGLIGAACLVALGAKLGRR